MRYLHHSTDPADPGHHAFLEARLAPLLSRLAPGARGLDYGAGRAGTLVALLTERGHHVERFDPCFAPNEHVLAATHDFVTCTEVIEHFHEPRRELAAIARLLHPGAYLAVTTVFVTDDIDFERWWYARDETHVSFYRSETMEWIGARFGWELLELSDAGALFVSR